MNSLGSGQARAPEFESFDLVYENPADNGLNLREIAALMWRGKLSILGCGLIGMLIGIVIVARQEPVYTASTSILFEPEPVQIVDLSNVLSKPESGTTIGNQIEILNSTTLLEQVVKRLELVTLDTDGTVAAPPEETPQSGLSLAKETVNDALEALGLAAPAPAAEAVPPTAEEQYAQGMRNAIGRLRANMGIYQVNGSGVIEVSYSSLNPAQSARIVNTVADEYIAFLKASKNRDVVTVIELVDERIKELKKNVASSEEDLETARLELANRQAQSSQMTSVQLTALNQELASIRLRIAESRARRDRARMALAAEENLWTVTEFRESALIAEFRRREISIRENMAGDNAIAGGSAKRNNMRNSALLEQLYESIREEAGYIVAALEFEVESLEQRETQLEGMVRTLEVTAIEQTADELAIERLEREVLSNQTLLQTFVTRQKEITEQASLQSAGARILSSADAPSSPDFEVSARTLLGTVGGGLLLGFLWLLIREHTSQVIREPRDLADVSQLPVLNSIPMTGMRRNLQTLGKKFMSRPKSLLSESIRNLRTSILYSDPAREPKVVMFTSSVPGEGKSSLSFLTGLASQGTGRRTILVCCDFRDDQNAIVYSKFPGVTEQDQGQWGASFLRRNRLLRDKRPGLASYLRKECTLAEALTREPGSGLDILALSRSEKLCESPADILSSERFTAVIEQLREEYDLVILDTPPTLAVTDARLLARLSDTVIYLVRWNHTSKNAVREGLRELRSMNAHVSGCVFTLVSQSQARKYTDNEFTYKRRYGSYFS
ncbi:hypothetical protein LHL23_22475 [Leisingera sp. McT4-56]|nr:hypothetical protein [Leisingera sp. McT4-56]